jgi:hypothetical protein
MTVSIPLLVLIVIVVYVAYRHLGLKIWHAAACLLLGFLLASTGAAPHDQQRTVRHRSLGAVTAFWREGVTRR